MLTTIEVAHQLAALCREGKFIEAQTSLMAPNCEQVEPAHANAPSVEGQPAILQKERAFQANLVKIHDTTISEPVVASNYFSMSMRFDLTLRDRGRVQLNEIGVWKVQDGKIVLEQFFY